MTSQCEYCGASFRHRPSRKARFCSAPHAYAGMKRPLADRFWEKVQKTEGCWLWTGATDGGGYGQIGSDTGSPVPFKAHRVSYQLHVGPIPDRLEVLHTCDNPPCVRPDHLFLGTQTDNMRDCAAKGRIRVGTEAHRRNASRGEGRWSARLTEADVVAIRIRYAAGGVTCAEIARDYPVCGAHIAGIVSRKFWKHVP